jgi:16S rRNA (guanine527-N7)-methyltransferase
LSRASLERQLAQGLAELKLQLPADAVARLLHYLELLQKWNRVYNLTAIREPSRWVSHHLLDSLSILAHLPPGSIVDVGSGAGLPGVPCAIARPDVAVALVESNHKKGAFLRQVAAECELRNVQVQISRAEDWKPMPVFDVAVSRAFSDLPGFIDASRDLLTREGVLAAMKGIYPDEELALLPADVALAQVLPLQVPGLRAQRHLVLLHRRS